MPDSNVSVSSLKNRAEEIRKRLDAYKAHQSDPYSYDQREIAEIREFHDNAAADIETLLNFFDFVRKTVEGLGNKSCSL